MTWKKLGRICCFQPSEHRSTNHMQGPVAKIFNENIRIYFAARHKDGRSYVAFVDVALDDPTRVIQLQESQIVPYGRIGHFDEDGIMPACVVEHDSKYWMYYSGWNRRCSIPYHNTTGLAVSEDGGESFSRMFDGPILERTPIEPFMAVTPWVVKEHDKWRMWYVSGLSWVQVRGKLEPVYGIKYAESADGISWSRNGQLVIPQKHEHEAMARPTVLQVNDRYHMWFSYRGSEDYRDGVDSYRIGYASSEDGHNWIRNDDEAGISASTDGWDSTMLCYPYVIEAGDRVLMFYNGNGFGQSGIGCAEWA